MIFMAIPRSHCISICVASLIVLAAPTVTAQEVVRQWVTAERLNVRTCPSTICGIVSWIEFRQGVKILERQDGWVRITEPYDAFCVDGQSRYVDLGNAVCNPENGIVGGQFAEWVSADFLSDTRPPDPAANASGAEELVVQSSDFARYRTVFTEAAQSLIAQRRCTEQDFREGLGWVKSTSYPRQSIYFTFCGGYTHSNRLYLNAETGEIFR